MLPSVFAQCLVKHWHCWELVIKHIVFGVGSSSASQMEYKGHLEHLNHTMPFTLPLRWPGAHEVTALAQLLAVTSSSLLTPRSL